MTAPAASAPESGLVCTVTTLWDTLPNVKNFVGRNRAFWEHWHPRALAVFGDAALGGVELEGFLRAINAVRPGLIRVEADEATYPLHVILRYEIERPLLEGEIECEDIPELWNAKMRDYLGLGA